MKHEYEILPEGVRFVVMRKGVAYECWLSVEDIELLTRRWFVQKVTHTYLRLTCNAPRVAGYRPPPVHLHQLILPHVTGLEVDHINRNPLDNRRANLRYATASENRANRVIKLEKRRVMFRGVQPAGHRFWARLSHAGKAIYLGIYPTAVAAALAYDRAAKQYYGEFAVLNFPAPKQRTRTQLR